MASADLDLAGFRVGLVGVVTPRLIVPRRHLARLAPLRLTACLPAHTIGRGPAPGLSYPAASWPWVSGWLDAHMRALEKKLAGIEGRPASTPLSVVLSARTGTTTRGRARTLFIRLLSGSRVSLRALASRTGSRPMGRSPCCPPDGESPLRTRGSIHGLHCVAS